MAGSIRNRRRVFVNLRVSALSLFPFSTIVAEEDLFFSA